MGRHFALYVASLGIEMSCGGQTRLEARGADAAIPTEAGVSGVETGANGFDAGSGLDAPEGSSVDDHVDGAGCYISAANYDQSCSVDSDCVAVIQGAEGGVEAFGLVVQSGNYCQPICMCGGEAINKSAAAQYLADVSETPLGSGAIKPLLPCMCPQIPNAACCSDGGCVPAAGCL
jgi:hypothetical protein